MRVSRTLMLIAMALVVVTAGIIGKYPAGQPNWLPRCLDSGLIAFETSASPEEVNMVWSQPDLKKENLTPNLKADFAFMIAYGLLFALLGYVAHRRARGWWRAAGAIAIVAAGITVALDATENRSTLKLLEPLKHGHLLQPADADRVATMRMASLGKWGMLGVTLLLLWGAFTPSRAGSALYRVLAHTIRILLAVTGIFGVRGVWDNPLIERVIPTLAVGLLAFILLVVFYWKVHVPENLS